MTIRAGKLLQGLVSLGLIVWLLWFIYNNWAMFESVARIAPAHIAGMAAFILISWYVNSLQSLILLRLERMQVGLWENLVVQTASVLGNYLPIRAGTLLRFAYFKRCHQLEYSRLGGLFAVRLLLLIAVTGWFGCVALTALDTVSPRVMAMLWVIFIAMSIVPVALWWLACQTDELPENRFGRAGRLFLGAFSTLRRQPRALFSVLMLTICQLLLLGGRLSIGFDAMYHPVSIKELILLAPAATLFSFLTIAPGDLGLREAVIGLLSMAIGYQFNIGVFATALDSAITLGCAALLGLPSTFWVLRKLHRPKENSNR